MKASLAILSLASIMLCHISAAPVLTSDFIPLGQLNATTLSTLLNEINTTESSGNPQLDTARQNVVQGLFDAQATLEQIESLAGTTSNSQVVSLAQSALSNVQGAQDAATNIELDVEQKQSVSKLDQFNVAKGLVLALQDINKLSGAIVQPDADLSSAISTANSAINQAISGGEGVLDAEGIDVTALINFVDSVESIF